jgi:hypothetical protein
VPSAGCRAVRRTLGYIPGLALCFADQPANRPGLHVPRQADEVVPVRLAGERDEVEQLDVQPLRKQGQGGKCRDDEPLLDTAEVPLLLQPGLVRELFLGESHLFSQLSDARADLCCDRVRLLSAWHSLTVGSSEMRVVLPG